MNSIKKYNFYMNKTFWIKKVEFLLKANFLLTKYREKQFKEILEL